MAAARINILYAVLATVAAAASGAWWAGSRIESPADAAARTAPPVPSPILVPVEERVLSSDVVTRGTVRFGLPQPVSIAPSSLKTSPGLIATLPLRNAQLEEGAVLLTASGRPVFVLQGQVPSYRDLVPGTSGGDVRQLKQALKRLGFDSGPVDGPYDQKTSAAVANWYKAGGWEPFGPTRDQLANVRNFEREWGDAAKNRLAAASAADSAWLAVDAARALAAQNMQAAGVESATRTAERRTVATDRGSAPIGVATERAKAEHANAAADADLVNQIADRALIALDPRQPETARLAADAKLEAARAAKERIRLEGELAIQAAEREAKMAGQKLGLAQATIRAARLEGERAVRAARDAQKVAAFEAKVAAERADQLATDLEVARSKLGIQVPADEIVFIRAFPVRVEEVTAAVGAPATGSVLTVTDNQLMIDSSLPLDAAPLIKPGMRVAIDEQALGVKATGLVEMVASTPGTRGVDGFHIYFEVRVDPTPVKLEGFSVRLTIPIESTKGVVTAVPVNALSLASDGTSRVQVEDASGLQYIEVKPGLSANGFVEVTAVNGKLTPGQRVVVGYNNPGSGT
jgi:peptidoglycan hydrolase-like protein with peptidoglycan-binding domain